MWAHIFDLQFKAATKFPHYVNTNFFSSFSHMLFLSYISILRHIEKIEKEATAPHIPTSPPQPHSIEARPPQRLGDAPTASRWRPCSSIMATPPQHWHDAPTALTQPSHISIVSQNPHSIEATSPQHFGDAPISIVTMPPAALTGHPHSIKWMSAKHWQMSTHHPLNPHNIDTMPTQNLANSPTASCKLPYSIAPLHWESSYQES